MERKKIKDLIIAELKVFWGEEPKDESSDTLTPVIKTNNLSYEGKISYDNLTLRKIDISKIKDNYLKNGDLLIEKSGGTKTHSVGYVNYFDSENDKYVANNFILAIRPNDSVVISKYLFYGIRYFYETGKFSDCFNKTTGIQNLKKKSYLSKELIYRDITNQKKIVEELDSIDSLLERKKEELSLLDELIKSRFIRQEVTLCF